VSSKKQLRRERRQQEKTGKTGTKVNPAVLFVLSILAVVLILGSVAFFVRGESEPPPWPGAVWSAEHGHWH
jgi:hypothetical protein